MARDGIEPPTPAFSGPRSTTELSGQCGRGNDSDDYKQGRGIGEVSEAGEIRRCIAHRFIAWRRRVRASLAADELLVEG